MTATTDDLLALRGVGQRIDSYSFDLVDSLNSPLGAIKPIRDGGITVENNTGRELYRSMNGFKLDATTAADINTASDRVRATMTVQTGDSFNLGVFLFGDANHGLRSWGYDLQGTLVDSLLVLRQPIGRVVGFPVGTNLVTAAVNIAAEVIASPISAVATGLTLTAPIAFRLDDTRQKIINTLLAAAGYLPCYFDNDGTLQMIPAQQFPAATPDFSYEAWNSSDGGKIHKDSVVKGDNFLAAPNRYIVVDTSATTAPVTGIYDIPDSAPNSFANRGFYVVKVVQLQGLNSNAAAANAAQAAYAADPTQFTRVTFDSTHDPRHDTFNIVDLLGDQYREIGWQIALRSGGTMSHDLRRAYA